MLHHITLPARNHESRSFLILQVYCLGNGFGTTISLSTLTSTIIFSFHHITSIPKSFVFRQSLRLGVKMDADALRMLADLGLERRDLVSAPDDVPSIRRVREDPREQAAIAKAFEKRRSDSSKGANGTEDERTARLKAWNSKLSRRHSQLRKIRLTFAKLRQPSRRTK